MAPNDKIIPIICPLCNQSFKKFTWFTKHTLEIHNIDEQDLYVQINGEKSCLCACGCGEKTTWYGWKKGYQKFIIGHNGNIYHSDAYTLAEAQQISQKRKDKLIGQPGWAKGLTKETDERIAIRGQKTSQGRKKAFDEGKITVWSKGLTKETDERVAKAALELKKGYASGEYVPWAKGKTKHTDERVANMGHKVSITHNLNYVKEQLNAKKRLPPDEILSRLDSSGYTLLSDVSSYTRNIDKTLQVRCKTCGHEFVECLGTLSNKHCPICFPHEWKTGCSRGQEEVSLFIESLGFQIDRNNRSILSNKQELDIYVPSRKFAIEYNGLFWHCELNKPTLYHENKSTMCKNENIILFHLFEDEWKNKTEIVQSLIRHKLGVTENKLYAKYLSLKTVDLQTATKFLEDNHLEGSTFCSFSFGLFDIDRLVMVMCCRIKYDSILKKDVCEIVRFCSLIDTHIVGGFSRLLKHVVLHCIDKNYSHITMQIDNRYDPISFERFGFKKHHTTKINYWWTDGISRFPKNKIRTNKTLNITEKQMAIQQNMAKIFCCYSDVYVLDV